MVTVQAGTVPVPAEAVTVPNPEPDPKQTVPNQVPAEVRRRTNKVHLVQAYVKMHVPVTEIVMTETIIAAVIGTEGTVAVETCGNTICVRNASAKIPNT